MPTRQSCRLTGADLRYSALIAATRDRDTVGEARGAIRAHGRHATRVRLGSQAAYGSPATRASAHPPRALKGHQASGAARLIPAIRAHERARHGAVGVRGQPVSAAASGMTVPSISSATRANSRSAMPHGSSGRRRAGRACGGRRRPAPHGAAAAGRVDRDDQGDAAVVGARRRCRRWPAAGGLRSTRRSSRPNSPSTKVVPAASGRSASTCRPARRWRRAPGRTTSIMVAAELAGEEARRRRRPGRGPAGRPGGFIGSPTCQAPGAGAVAEVELRRRRRRPAGAAAQREAAARPSASGRCCPRRRAGR